MDIYIYTLWLWLTVRHGFSMALIEIDGLPFLKMVTFHGYVSRNQMVKSCLGGFSLAFYLSSPTSENASIWGTDFIDLRGAKNRSLETYGQRGLQSKAQDISAESLAIYQRW